MPRVLSLLVVVLLLAGCRESLTGPDPDPILPDPIPEAPGASIYVKGPEVLHVSDVGRYRAEPLTDPRLDHYEWTYYGAGTVSAQPTDPSGQNRLIEAEAVMAGTVQLVVRAYDADGNRIGTGTKDVTIHPF